MLESRGCPMQVQSDNRFATYQITSDDYGTRSQRLLDGVLKFFVIWSFLFVGFSTIDFFAKVPRLSVTSRESLIHNGMEALIVAAIQTLFVICTAWKEFTLEIETDHVTVYEGKGVDPLHRQGRTIPRSQIREIAESRPLPIFASGLRGLLIKYGRWSLWSGKRILLPAGMPNYAEVKAHVLAWYTNVP